MNELTVTVTEQPGETGSRKARALCALFLRFYAEHKEEVDRKAEELAAKQSAESERSFTHA